MRCKFLKNDTLFDTRTQIQTARFRWGKERVKYVANTLTDLSQKFLKCVLCIYKKIHFMFEGDQNPNCFMKVNRYFSIRERRSSSNPMFTIFTEWPLYKGRPIKASLYSSFGKANWLLQFIIQCGASPPRRGASIERSTEPIFLYLSHTICYVPTRATRENGSTIKIKDIYIEKPWHTHTTRQWHLQGFATRNGYANSWFFKECWKQSVFLSYSACPVK